MKGLPSPKCKGQGVASFRPPQSPGAPHNRSADLPPSSAGRSGERTVTRVRTAGLGDPRDAGLRSPVWPPGEPPAASALTFGRSSPDLGRCGASTWPGAEAQRAETQAGARRAAPLSSRRPHPAPLLPPPAGWCRPLSAPGHLWVGLGEGGARGWRPPPSPCRSPRTPGRARTPHADFCRGPTWSRIRGPRRVRQSPARSDSRSGAASRPISVWAPSGVGVGVREQLPKGFFPKWKPAPLQHPPPQPTGGSAVDVERIRRRRENWKN